MKTKKFTVEIDVPDYDDYFGAPNIRDILRQGIDFPIRVKTKGTHIIATANEPVLPPPTISDEWEQFRREAVKDILCANYSGNRDIDICCAIRYADELIKQLKEDKQ